MNLQKLNVKFFVEEPDRLPLTAFIDIFHGWIQAADGEYIDVADYSHMKAGPGIILIANDANVSIDESGGRRGLLYNQKSPLTGSIQEKFIAVASAALQNCRRLEREPALTGKIKFSANEMLISVNDRLAAPNIGESLELLRTELAAITAGWFDGANLDFSYGTESRKCFSIAVRASRPLNVDALIALAEEKFRYC